MELSGNLPMGISQNLYLVLCYQETDLTLHADYVEQVTTGRKARTGFG